MDKKYTELAGSELKEAKQSVRLFGLDYDGTISDGANYKMFQVFDLVERILAKDKSVAFITARAATGLKILVPLIQELFSKIKTHKSCFIAGGNGTILHQIKGYSEISIYNHGYGSLKEIKHVCRSGIKVYAKLGISISDLAEKGRKTFRNFLRDDWRGYIPDEILDICRSFDGWFFAEEAKVTFVLPKDKSLHERVIAELNNELGKEYCAVAGNDTYVHITKRLKEDGKRVAIKTILDFLSLKENQVVTFGDMPSGNDAGLLSFPFSFTNSEEFLKVKRNLEDPPFVLPDSGLTPVARVYKAIDFLISD